MDIQQNEAVDRLAKLGASQEVESESLSFAALRRLRTKYVQETTQAWWNDNAPAFYRDLSITTFRFPPPEISLPRATLGWLIASRTKHGDFADYHERFGHETAELHCACGRRKAPIHFFFCRIARRKVGRSLGPPSCIPDLLSTDQGIAKLVLFLNTSRFYLDICVRRPSRIVEEE